MVALLFKLLIIQITMQLTFETVLEGRTAHYVQLLDTPADANAQRLTCPVFSIKFANKEPKYYKYTVSSIQYALVNWESDAAANFKECADAAATGDKKMFMYENECFLSDSLLSRLLPEPCEDDTATIVYMIQPPETSCIGENFVMEHGATYNDFFCGSATILIIECSNSFWKTNEPGNNIAHFMAEGECYSLNPRLATEDHLGQSTACARYQKQTCKPADADSRATFVQHLSAMSLAFGIPFAVDLAYNELSAGAWMWRETAVLQPGSESGEWTYNGDPSISPYAYMSQGILVNAGIDLAVVHTCCRQ